MRSDKQWKGFTLVELLVSMTILIIITVAVATDISISRQQEELASNARYLQSMLRDVQSQAQSAVSLNTCDNGAFIAICEFDTSNCGAGTCDTQIVPSAQGIRLSTTHQDHVFHFAEVDPLLENRQYDENETVLQNVMQTARANINTVEVTRLTIGSTDYDTVDVTFGRQSGAMEIIADTGATGNTLEIELTHRETGSLEVISLNRLTGRITIN